MTRKRSTKRWSVSHIMKSRSTHKQHNDLCFPPQGRLVTNSCENGMASMIDAEPSRAELAVDARKVLTYSRHPRDSSIILSDSLSAARANGFTIRIESPDPQDLTRGRGVWRRKHIEAAWDTTHAQRQTEARIYHTSTGLEGPPPRGSRPHTRPPTRGVPLAPLHSLMGCDAPLTPCTIRPFAILARPNRLLSGTPGND